MGHWHVVGQCPIFKSMLAGLTPELAAGIEAELRAGQLIEQFKATANQAAIGRINSVAHRSVDGLGKKVASIDGESYHYWGKRLGYECWRDNQFLEEYLRDNPQCRVAYAPTTFAATKSGRPVSAPGTYQRVKTTLIYAAR